jgi:hypothetical protein
MYAPFLLADRFDKFWGAKLVARFTRDQLRAAVDAARLTDPAAAAYLTDTLVTRQRLTARYWFTRVNPLDGFTVAASQGGASLCFDDLLLTYRLLPVAADTRYTVTSHDRAGRVLARGPELVAAPAGRTCSAPLTLAGSGDGYTIVRVETRRPLFHGVTDVHLARDPATSRYRLIGIWRP